MSGYIQRYLTSSARIRGMITQHIFSRFYEEREKYVEERLMREAKERDLSQRLLDYCIKDFVQEFVPSCKLSAKIALYVHDKEIDITEESAQNWAWHFYTQHFSVLFRYWMLDYGIRLCPQSTKYAALCFDWLGEDDGFWSPAYGNNYVSCLQSQRTIMAKDSVIYKWADKHSIVIDSPNAKMPDELHSICEHAECNRKCVRSYVITRWNARRVHDDFVKDDDVDHVYCENCFRRIFRPDQFGPNFIRSEQHV